MRPRLGQAAPGKGRWEVCEVEERAMAHLFDLAGSRERVRAMTGMAVILSLLLVQAVESSHAHESGPDSPGACSVCQVVHNPGSTIASGTPILAGSDLLRTPALPGRRFAPAIVHLTPRRSRAPPLHISL